MEHSNHFEAKEVKDSSINYLCANTATLTVKNEHSQINNGQSATITEGSHDNSNNNNINLDDEASDVKELLIIGAGPHSLTLLLRLLEPDPDLLSDKERHRRAIKNSQRRNIHDLKRHVKHLSRGPSATLSIKKKRNSTTDTNRKNSSSTSTCSTKTKKKSRTKNSLYNAYNNREIPPPIDLEDILDKTTIIDSYGEWLHGWKENFNTIGIKQLRSLMNAHADPYDHRSLEYYAELSKRGNELITLPHLLQRDKNFAGPYQVPSTKLFNDFHDLLIDAYGVKDVVERGFVKEIICKKQCSGNNNDEEPVFEIRCACPTIFNDDTNDHHGDHDDRTNANKTTRVMRAKRIVFAMGPNFASTDDPSWLSSLRMRFIESNIKQEILSQRILQTKDIIPWLKKQQQQQQQSPSMYKSKPIRLLIVGGGITSAQLAISASKSSWCEQITLIQRSCSLSRHFDVQNEWMGAARGKLLDKFWSSDVETRAHKLKEARRGGSIPPEILSQLHSKYEESEGKLELVEEMEISHVDWNFDTEELEVTMDDEMSSMAQEYDMIWLVTGCQNHVLKYPALASLLQSLPLKLVNGLPVLGKDLSWSDGVSNEKEPSWKKVARARCWCMGVLAGLELGPDALNLVGARQGSVRIAQSIRFDMMMEKQ